MWIVHRFQGFRVLGIRGLGGFFAGCFPLLLGYYLAPSPTYDPGGWGPCTLRSVFPVLVESGPAITPYCFDCYDCVFSPVRFAIFVVVVGGLFALSGAFMVWVSKVPSVPLSVAPTLVLVPALLFAMSFDRELRWWPTLALGAAVLICAVLLAAAGGFLAGRGK